MSATLQAQAQMGQQLVDSMNHVVSHSTQLTAAFENQLTLSNSLCEAILNLNNKLTQISQNLLGSSDNLNQAFNTDNFDQNFSRNQKELEKSCSQAADAVEGSSSTLSQISSDQDKLAKLRESQVANRKKAYKQTIVAFNESNYFFKKLDGFFVSANTEFRSLTKKLKETPLITRAFKTRGLSLIVDIPRMIFKTLFNVLGSIISTTTTFFKTIITLPLMVANIAVSIGNGFREDIIVGIGNAYQATKEYSDANSTLGKGISNLRGMSVGALKTFENPRSSLVKLFGEGASGAQTFLTETANSINDMGHFAELFGYQITNSMESAEYFAYAKKALGLSSKEVAYYALDAGVNLENIYDRLDNVRKTIEEAASRHGQDTKQVSLGMQKLRTNIKDFGHLSDQNLSNLVARMRKLNVSAEDLTSTFQKFKSLEEASKTSAMLYQSFQMNIDALSLLTAKDPGEIVDQFRDAMFATGRSYEELNRHEKALMQQTTGMNDAMLKSLMTYQDMGLSYEEARQRMADDDPTKQQIKAIEELTSSISEIQRIMTFQSPFEAFLKGLGKNAAASGAVKKLAISLSNIYEDIYLFGLNLDAGIIKQMTVPVIAILRKIDEVFKSEAFRNILRTGTETFSKITSFVAGDMSPNKKYKELSTILDDLNAMEKTSDKDLVKDKEAIKSSALKAIEKANNKELNKYLKERNILTNDGKFVKDVSLVMILNQLKKASLNIKSKKGAAAIGDITTAIRSEVDKNIGDYFKYDVFMTGRGIKGQINQTTQALKDMFSDGSGLLKTIYNLGKNILGAIIKGTAIGLFSILKVLTGTIDKTYDKLSSPLANFFRKSFGYKEGEQFSLLNWLGISKEDSEDLQQELIKSLKGLTKSSGNIFMAGLGITSKLYGIFASFAGFLIKSFATFIYEYYQSADFFERQYIKLGGFDIDAIRKKALEMSAKSGGLTGISKKIKENMKKGKAEAKSYQGGVDALLEVHTNMKNEYNKLGYNKPYGKAISDFANNYSFDQSFIVRMMTSPEKRDFFHSIAALNIIRAEKYIESYMSQKEFLNLIQIVKNKQGNTGSFDEVSFQKEMRHYSELIHNNALKSYDNSYYKKVIKKVFPKGNIQYFDESKGNKALLGFIENINGIDTENSKMTADSFYKKHGIKDGILENSINAMFANEGLKLFTSDGKVVIPHSLDELSALSKEDKGSLTSVFGSIASAYQSAATAVAVMNKEKTIKREDSEYAASDELIDKMLKLVHETLEICINRDIQINQVVG